MVAAIAPLKQMISIVIHGAMKLFWGHLKKKKTEPTLRSTGSRTAPGELHVGRTAPESRASALVVRTAPDGFLKPLVLTPIFILAIL